VAGADEPAAARAHADADRYASSKNAFTDFPAQGGAVRYGSRRCAGEQIALQLSHAGTAFDLSYSQPEAGRAAAQLVHGQARRVGPALLAVLDAELAAGRE
jgi:hypothetical protein